MRGLFDLARWQRAWKRWESRSSDYANLRAAASADQARQASASRPIPFFNGNVLRAKVAQGLSEAAKCEVFWETGTSHAATAIGANRFLRLPVRSCENNSSDYWISRVMTAGIRGISLWEMDSRRFLSEVLPEAKLRGEVPFIYLDAHEGALDRNSLPLVDEIRAVLELDSFVVLVDDFRVPGNGGFHWGTYGETPIEVDLIAPLLVSAGIHRVWFPAYSPTDESGFPSGFCVFWRSPAADAACASAMFPFNMIRPINLEGGTRRETGQC